jgi:hypothetical protein
MASPPPAARRFCCDPRRCSVRRRALTLHSLRLPSRSSQPVLLVILPTVYFRLSAQRTALYLPDEPLDHLAFAACPASASKVSLVGTFVLFPSDFLLNFGVTTSVRVESRFRLACAISAYVCWVFVELRVFGLICSGSGRKESSSRFRSCSSANRAFSSLHSGFEGPNSVIPIAKLSCLTIAATSAILLSSITTSRPASSISSAVSSIRSLGGLC